MAYKKRHKQKTLLKYYDRYHRGYQIPHKWKVRLFGPKQKRKELRKLLKKVDELRDWEWDGFIHYSDEIINHINGELFCPKCGCIGDYGTGNTLTYPEHYEEFYCTRCNFLVGIIDNSPFYHALQFPDYTVSE